MSTPPRVARAELDAAVRRIANRHRKIDDELFGHVDLDKPADVLDYLRKHNRGISGSHRWVAQADVSDGLVLHVWLWWEERRREYELLVAGVKLGVPLAQLGSPLGLGSRVRSARGNRRKGVQDRIDRLAALLRFETPDATITRDARRAEREAAGKADPQAAWLAEHHDWIATVAARLLAYEHLADDEAADQLVEVRHDWRDGSWTPGSLVWMGLAAAALRASPAVLELGSRHGVHRALKDVDDLRSAFAGLARVGRSG